MQTGILFAVFQCGCGVLGQELAILVHEYQQPENCSVFWNGQDFKGQELASGIYLYALEIGARRLVRKMIFSK